MTRLIWQQLAQELNSAPYGAKKAILARWQEQTGLSQSSLWRHAKKSGGYKPQERKRRADAGAARCGVTEAGLNYVVALMVASHRKTGSIEMPTTEAVDECIRQGVLPTDTKIATVRRLLRERGISRRALQANYTTDGQTVSAGHVRLVSEGPNHMHQVDVSACLHWHFKKKGGLSFRHKTLELAGGKKAEPYRNIREHILRYVLVDHFSGAFYVRYYLAAGETALNLIDFLYNAWRRREHEKDIFHGAPKLLYFDAGSANTAQITGNLLDNLQIEHRAHEAGVARATGAAECYQGIWQRYFESKLFLHPPENLEELNARADDSRIYHNAARKNSATGKTRWEAWAGIRAQDLRIIPPREIYQELVHEKPHRTKARADGIVRHKGSRHLIMEPINIGESLMVLRNPYRLPELLVFRVKHDGTRGDLLETRHMENERDLAVAVGEFKRRPDTPAQRAAKLASAADLAPFAKTVFAAKIPELPENVAYLERKGQEIEVQPPSQPQPQEDVAARPAWFATSTERYEWCLRHQAAGGELDTNDEAWMAEFVETDEYRAQADWWEQLSRHLNRQAATGGKA